MKRTLSVLAAIVAVGALAAPASAKGGGASPVTITLTSATCNVSGLLASDYNATVALTGTVAAVDLHDATGLLAANVTLPGLVTYFGPVGQKTDNVYATLPGSSVEIASLNVHTPCVKAPQGQA